MNAKENMLRAINFESPDYVPVSFCINAACWNTYPQEFLLEQMEKHELLFPKEHLPKFPVQPEFHNVCRKDKPFLDDWGCKWVTSMDGITGTVVEHPQKSWMDFHGYQAPDANCCMGIGIMDWEQERMRMEAAKEAGHITIAGLRHGHTFLQLCDIRGYENLLYDMIDGNEHLPILIQMVEDFNMEIIKKYVEMDVDIISYAEDLGMQVGPMLSPEQFRTYIKPSYQRLMEPAKRKDKIIHMHSDGDIRLLVDDIIDSGVKILNLQDLVNGLDWIEAKLAGEICIELDVDRQTVTPFGSPADIHP